MCSNVDVKLAALGPFVAGLLLALGTPLLSRVVRRDIVALIERTCQHAGFDIGRVPPFLRQEYVGDYVEYSADTVQALFVPVTAIVGAVFALASGISTIVASLILVVGFVVTVFLLMWILNTDPSRYVAAKWLGYSKITATGVVFNIVGAVLVGIVAHC